MPPAPGPSRVVLVTGCSSGIGRATAARLAGAGHVVYATARRVEAMAGLEDAGCRLLPLDVTDEASMRAAVDRVEAEHGAVGALVNNAGYSQSGAVETISPQDLRRQFETNVFGLVRLCQLVLPGMRARRSGRIVNVSSMGGTFTFPGGGAYHATKHAVEALSDALRFEVKGFGVDVVVIQPGLIRTGFAATAAAAADPGGSAAGGDGTGDGAGAAGDGPYAAFNTAVARATRDAYERGPLARLGGGPDAVAEAIEDAITRPRPKIRYRVTPSAKLLIAQRRVLPDALWDRFLASSFPRP